MKYLIFSEYRSPQVETLAIDDDAFDIACDKAGTYYANIRTDHHGTRLVEASYGLAITWTRHPFAVTPESVDEYTVVLRIEARDVADA